VKIEITTTPTNGDIDFLSDKLKEESRGFGPVSNFGIFVKDDNNKIIAGCNGYILFGGIYTDQLWVDKDYRMSGIGRKIIDKVHSYARENGCKIASVTTMSFQNARGFYEKLGYKVDFERHGYNCDSSMIFLSQIL
jgi:GNAT superfamily N-acetyltransferase